MLTTNGKTHVRRYLAQYVPAIAGAMCFGIGDRDPDVNDLGLQFEVARSEIKLIQYNFATNQIIYKAQIPLSFSGTIYEVGLYSTLSNNLAGSNGSKSLTDINLGEVWVLTDSTTPSAFTSSNIRIGSEGLSQTQALSTTRSDALVGITLDLSGYSNADIITVALNVGNANTNAITITFITDASNYYSFTSTTPVQSSGYKIIDFIKGTATVTGSPNWQNITEIRVSSTTKSSGVNLLSWDGIMIQDTDTANLDYLLVARTELATPLVKIANQTVDFEFAVDVAVT